MFLQKNYMFTSNLTASVDALESVWHQFSSVISSVYPWYNRKTDTLSQRQRYRFCLHAAEKIKNT